MAGGRKPVAGESRERVQRSLCSLGSEWIFWFRVLCVNGILSSGMESYIPSFQTASLVSFPTIPVPVKFLRYSHVPNEA